MTCAILVGLLFTWLSAGCSFTGTRALGNERSLNQIHPGASTKAHVKQVFGEPSSQRFSPAGVQEGKIWVYEYSRSDVNPLAFIPPVSLVLLACCEWHTVETRTLIVEFGPGEVVRRLNMDMSIK
jgi:hypothetical protein